MITTFKIFEGRIKHDGPTSWEAQELTDLSNAGVDFGYHTLNHFNHFTGDVTWRPEVLDNIYKIEIRKLHIKKTEKEFYQMIIHYQDGEKEVKNFDNFSHLLNRFKKYTDLEQSAKKYNL